MSVMTFGVGELANVAAAIISMRHPGGDIMRDVERVAVRLALVSQANVACFNDKYAQHNDPAEAVTAVEIVRELRKIQRYGQFPCDMGSAVSTAGLFHYNCDDDNGDFTLRIEGAASALASLLGDLLRVVAMKARVAA